MPHSNIGHRDVLRIALPMILSNLSVPLVGMVDTAVMGHLPKTLWLAAVAVAGSLFALLFVAFNFLRMSATGTTARAWGAGDMAASGRALAQGLVLAVLIGVTLIVLGPLLGGVGLPLIGAEGDITREARVYFDIRIWSAPFVLGNYVLVGWFLGMQNARAPLVVMLSNNLLNLSLDLWLVLGQGMHADGVAWASLVAEMASFSLASWIAIRYLDAARLIRCNPRLFPTAELRALLKVNSDLFVRTLALVGVLTAFTALGARLGEGILAANALLMNLQTLLAFGLDGFAHAAEALVGRALGRRDAAMFRRVLLLTLQWSGGIALLYVLGFAAFGKELVGLLTSIPEVRATAENYLGWMRLSPLVAVWAFWLDGVFIGAGWSRMMRNRMLLSAFGFLAGWYLLRGWGNQGLWLSLMLFFLLRGVTLGVGLIQHRGLRPI